MWSDAAEIRRHEDGWTLAGCSERAQMKQLAQSSWLKPRVKVLASEDDGCALGVITELRMEPARLVASFAPMLGSDAEPH